MVKFLLVFFSSLILFSCSSITFKSSSDYKNEQNLEEQDFGDKILSVRKSSGYVFGTNDIPLLVNLEIIEDKSTNFDTISGNIAISYYSTNLKLEDVQDFYMTTLPQLGFIIKSQKGSKISYERGDDNLQIAFDKQDELLVKFLISSN